MNKKLRVAVLMGGRSPEYEISLISGKEVLANLPKKYIGIPIVIPKNGNKWLNNLLEAKADICFIAMHGPFGEDGKIQGMLDTLGIKYTGSGVAASAIGIDKILFRKIMKAEDILMPKDTTKLPCFIKPHNQGSSIGASIVRNKTELARAIKIARRYSDKILIEEYLVGKELTCAVLGNNNPTPLPVIEIVPKKGEFFDYESKYSESGADEIVPARISKKLTKIVQELSIKVHQIIGAKGFSRVDFILKENKYPVILEINTIPGLTPMSLLPKAAKAYGLSYSELLDRIIKYSVYE
ncbi:MAG: D-alanine--D-alanine ligase [Patescibacteria group bacterium]